MNKYLLNPSGHALILGASGGIGSEIARSLAFNGVKKLTLSYGGNRAKAEELVAELSELGTQAHLIQVSKRNDQTKATFRSQLDEAATVLGEEINTLVDCIGISPNTPLEEQTLDDRTGADGEVIPGWRSVFEVNVFGCFISTQVVLERMLERKIKGSVVLITSTNGTTVENSGAPYSMHYNASKAALIQMVHDFALANKLRPIRVNGVAPGWINTPMNHTLPDGEFERETGRIWMGRFAEPSEVASTVTFLVGPGASYINAQNVIVSGGYN